MKHAHITLLISFFALISHSQAETEVPEKWDLKIVDSSNLLTDLITTTQKNFWFSKDNRLLTSYMLDFTLNHVESGVYFATERLTVPASTTNNGIGAIVKKSNNIFEIGIHESSKLISDTLSISEGDILRFAYNAASHNAYLFNTSTNDIVSITLSESLPEYNFQTGDKISNFASGFSYANPNRGGGIYDKTSATYGDIYDMSCLADNEQVFLSFVQTLSVNSIPEPAAPLLSIYALAILAARRRRK